MVGGSLRPLVELLRFVLLDWKSLPALESVGETTTDLGCLAGWRGFKGFGCCYCEMFGGLIGPSPCPPALSVTLMDEGLWFSIIMSASSLALSARGPSIILGWLPAEPILSFAVDGGCTRPPTGLGRPLEKPLTTFPSLAETCFPPFVTLSADSILGLDVYKLCSVFS